MGGAGFPEVPVFFPFFTREDADADFFRMDFPAAESRDDCDVLVRPPPRTERVGVIDQLSEDPELSEVRPDFVFGGVRSGATLAVGAGAGCGW